MSPRWTWLDNLQFPALPHPALCWGSHWLVPRPSWGSLVPRPPLLPPVPVVWWFKGNLYRAPLVGWLSPRLGPFWGRLPAVWAADWLLAVRVFPKDVWPKWLRGEP